MVTDEASADGQGVIVRICEEKGVRSACTLRIRFPYTTVTYVTPDEKPLRNAEGTKFTLAPFEICTLKIC